MDQSPLIRGNIQQHNSISTHRFQIDIPQLFKGTYLLILLLMIEPARSDGQIRFCRIINQLLFILQLLSGSQFHLGGIYSFLPKLCIILLLTVLRYLLRLCQFGRNHTPLTFSGHPCFITAPPYIRPTDGYTGLGLQPAYRFIIAFPVIFLYFSVGSLSTGSIQPNNKNLSVFR